MTHKDVYRAERAYKDALSADQDKAVKDGRAVAQKGNPWPYKADEFATPATLTLYREWMRVLAEWQRSPEFQAEQDGWRFAATGRR